MQEKPIDAPVEVMQAEVETSSGKHDVTIPVEHYLPENVPTYYSDGMAILHSANEFVISFLLTEFPLALSAEELKEVKLLKRRCIARIIVSPAQFEAITKVARDQMDKYIETYRKPEST